MQKNTKPQTGGRRATSQEGGISDALAATTPNNPKPSASPFNPVAPSSPIWADVARIIETRPMLLTSEALALAIANLPASERERYDLTGRDLRPLYKAAQTMWEVRVLREWERSWRPDAQNLGDTYNGPTGETDSPTTDRNRRLWERAKARQAEPHNFEPEELDVLMEAGQRMEDNGSFRMPLHHEAMRDLTPQERDRAMRTHRGELALIWRQACDSLAELGLKFEHLVAYDFKCR